MQNLSPNRFIIGERHGCPLHQRLYNILWEYAAAHFTVQQSLQMLPLDSIISLQTTVCALCAECAFHDFKQIRRLNAELSLIPAAMRIPHLHPL